MPSVMISPGPGKSRPARSKAGMATCMSLSGSIRKTAAERGIKNGDIVKVFNERGTVLGGAYVTERMMPGVAYMDHGARCDWIITGKA